MLQTMPVDEFEANVDEHKRKQLICHRLDFWKCKTQQIK